FEGTGPTAAPSNTTSVSRAGNGCTDTDSNVNNFTAGTVNPRNTSSTLNPCGGSPPAPSPEGFNHFLRPFAFSASPLWDDFNLPVRLNMQLIAAPYSDLFMLRPNFPAIEMKNPP